MSQESAKTSRCTTYFRTSLAQCTTDQFWCRAELQLGQAAIRRLSGQKHLQRRSASGCLHRGDASRNIQSICRYLRTLVPNDVFAVPPVRGDSLDALELVELARCIQQVTLQPANAYWAYFCTQRNKAWPHDLVFRHLDSDPKRSSRTPSRAQANASPEAMPTA